MLRHSAMNDLNIRPEIKHEAGENILHQIKTRSLIGPHSQ